MTKPISLAERRWDASDDRPGSHTLRDMLEAVIAKIDAGALVADHMILVWGREADGVGDDGYFQAWKFGPYGQAGLLQRGFTLLSESD